MHGKFGYDDNFEYVISSTVNICISTFYKVSIDWINLKKRRAC